MPRTMICSVYSTVEVTAPLTPRRVLWWLLAQDLKMKLRWDGGKGIYIRLVISSSCTVLGDWSHVVFLVALLQRWL